MALEIYRSATQGSASFDRHSELCRSCAEKEIKEGFYVEYDWYLSERSNVISREDSCEVCQESFFIDGRKKEKILEGAVY